MKPARNRRLRPLWIVLLVVSVAVGAFFLITALSVMRHAQRDDAQPAGAIVVFGAAEYAGRPSPVYKARLDHALGLYRRGLAPLVITSGGHGGDPTYTEGGVGRDYLKSHGIPDAALIAETQAEDTAHSAERVAAILRANGVADCIAVSDSYHLFRIRQVMQAQGVRTYASPRPSSIPQTAWLRWKQALRESLSFLAWKLGVT